MKAQSKIALLIFLAVATSLNSCTKEGDGENENCRLASVAVAAPTGNELYSFTYNNDDLISRIDVTGPSPNSKVFTYPGNSIVINTTWTTNNGTYTRMDSIAIDDRRRPLFMRQYNDTRTDWTDFSFEYNGDEMTRHTSTASNSAIPNISTCINDNGNLVRIEGTSLTSILDYYMDEQKQLGDYLDFTMLTTYGTMIYPHKNLTRSLTYSSGASFYFTYEKNKNGQISKATATGRNQVQTLTFHYECD